MKTIPLSRPGWVCWLDDEDFQRYEGQSWLCEIRGHRAYAYKENWHQGKRGPRRVMHREIMNAQPGQEVDHKIHRPLAEKVVDNRKSNLRLCTPTENRRSTRKITRPCSSCFKGVTWDACRQRWMGQIKIRGKHHAKRFGAESDAAAWYDAQALLLFGEFALTNFTGPNAIFASLPLSPSLSNSPEPW